MNRWDMFERLFASVLAVVQPFIIYFLYGDDHAISRCWDTPLQPLFIITNALVSFFFFKMPKWRIPATLLLILTSFSVTDHFVLHNIFAILFFIFSAVSLWGIKKFRYYFFIFLLSVLFLFDGLFWAETWGIITLVFYHTHLTIYRYLLEIKKMNVNSIVKGILNELTSSRYGGYYNGPLTMGEVDWDKEELGPFTKKVSDFFNADLAYDSYDGKIDSHLKNSKKLESKSRRISKYNKTHKQLSDEEGGPINATPGKGKKIVPVNEWVELNKIPLNEDLAVWFGKKKKPKGSSQPKGPWVDICRKADGKHPPCGRSDADKGSYPKCRAAGVAGKMSDSQKRSACQQKRRAEKKDTQSGKGQKPVMTSYKTKKTQKESLEIIVRNILSSL